METPTHFKGLCPFCYKPIKEDMPWSVLEDNDSKAVYHTECIQTYIRQAIAKRQSDRRDEVITENSEDWQFHGERLKELREQYGLTVHKVAKELCVSPARVRRLENGEPVRDARLLRRAYYLLLHYANLQNNYDDLVVITQTVNAVNELYSEHLNLGELVADDTATETPRQLPTESLY